MVNVAFEDAEEFSKDQEVQLMTFEQELDVYFHDLEINTAEKRGEERLGKLINALLQDNNKDAIPLVTTDQKARQKYYIKYNI